MVDLSKEERYAKIVSVDAGLEPSEVIAMMRGFLRHQQILKDAVKLGLRPEHFKEVEFYYLYSALIGLSEKFGYVSADMLLTELHAWSQSGVLNTYPNLMAFLCGTEPNTGFIFESFQIADASPEELRSEKAFVEDLVRRCINDRVIRVGLQNELSVVGDAGAPKNFGSRLDSWTTRAQAVDFIGRSVTSNADMPEFGAKIVLPPKPEVTGLPWIDNYIGGIRPGDVVGCMGPYAGGKTTLLATAAVRVAQNYYAQKSEKVSVFICYEDGGDKMNHLFWSAAAHIDRKLFEENEHFWSLFSTSAETKDYDRILPENKNGKIILGERERWDAARSWLNKHFVSLDFSANSAHGSGYGSGGVPEIVNVLSKFQEDSGMEIGFVAVDYAGLMLNRYLSLDSKTKNAEQIWRQMQMLPDELKTQVAIPFKATVFLAHQLAGADIKNRPVYRYVDHLDSQGSKSFAENLHSCLCINKRDPETGVSTINWSKIRARVPVTPFGLIKLDSHVVDVHLVNDQYIASETSRRIIRKGETGLVTPDPEVAANIHAKERRTMVRPTADFAAENGLD